MRQRRSAALLCCVVGLAVIFMSSPAHATVIETNEWSNVTDPGWGYVMSSFGVLPSIDLSTPSPSGGGAVKFTFPAGTYSTSFGPGVAFFRPSPAQSELYTGFWFRWSPGFVFHPVATKILYQYGGVASIATGALPYMTVRTSTTTGTICCDVDIGIQGNGAAGSLSRSLQHTLKQNRASVNIGAGVWRWMEVHIKANSSPTVNDGILEIWIDDVLTHQHTNILYFDKADAWAEVKHSPEYGGGGNSSIPSTQFMYVDHIVISTTRIGHPAVGGDTTAPARPTNFVAY